MNVNPRTREEKKIIKIEKEKKKAIGETENEFDRFLRDFSPHPRFQQYLFLFFFFFFLFSNTPQNKTIRTSNTITKIDDRIFKDY